MIIALQFEHYLMLALSIVALALAAWAFADCLRRGAANFQREGKRTKTFWMALTGGATVVCLFSAWTALAGGSGGGGFFQLIAACAAAVYLADVKPAIGGGNRRY